MAGFGKWIGGGLGWVLGGGPLGAILGFAIGSMFDNTNVHVSTSGSAPGRTTEGDFKMSLLVLMACIMKADGRVDKSELAVVKRFLVANFGEDGALEALQVLKNILQQDIDESQVAMQISQHLNYSMKLEMLNLLFTIAYADGEVVASELNVIQRISAIFHITSSDFASIQALFMKHVDADWAYKALELEPTATNDEIKKAYRKMAMKHHPDKVQDLGEEVKKSATDKFRAINEAYESLKKQRGMN